MKKAWIENDTVRDICPGNPAECYHPDIAAHYNTDVPDDTVNGATLVDGEWTNPVIPEPTPVEPAAPKIKVSPVEFKLLFTGAERIAIKTARLTNPILEDAFEILEDTRLKEVDLSIKSNQDLIAYMVTLGLLNHDRADQIINGVIQ